MSQLTSQRSLILRILNTICSVLWLTCSAIAQEAGPNNQAEGAEPKSRKRTAVYPLDAVSPNGVDTYVVDRNLPGIFKHDGNTLTIFVQGDKKFRQPLNAPRCIAASASGKLYVGDSATREIYEIDAEGKFTPLTNGLIGVPVDLAIGADDTIYVADLERRAVWRWKLGGDAKPEVYLPKANARGLAIDKDNNLWVLSQNKTQVLRYDAAGNETFVVSDRNFEFAHNIEIDSSGIAWVSDGYAKAIWKIVPDGKPEKAIQSPELINPVGLFWRGQSLGIVDPHAMEVFTLSDDLQIAELFAVSETQN